MPLTEKIDTEYECREYEKKQENLQKAYKAINTLKNYYKGVACPNCPFFLTLINSVVNSE